MNSSNSVRNSKYLRMETLGGLVLLLAAIAGFALNNSPLESYYDDFVNFQIRFSINNFSFSRPLIFWINDGLVSVFFLMIGLEIKSMLYSDAFSEKSQFTAPFSAAILGAIVPAIIFTIFNYDNHINMRGWAIPTAMDTAFILGILAMVGPSISNSLKMFVMTLSIIDDILAVLVIAVFYAEDLSNIAIIGSTTVVGILVLANQAGVRRGAVYLSLGFLLWLMVLGSGVHTSIAGVLLAATMPMNLQEPKRCLVTKAKNMLHPWVSFLILPLFAFANTGFDLADVSLQSILHPLALGIILGLFIGKQLGIFGIISILVKYNIVKLPGHTTWWQMYGVSVLCGVGFTMSLFIGVLAFENGGPDYDDIVKASVFIGSLLSAITGYAILFFKRQQ